MPVTDDQVAALRAQLSGDYDEHRRLVDALHAQGALPGYATLVTAAFVEAADRRFPPGRRGDDVVAAYVGDVRSRFPGADEIDADAAQRVIGKAFGRGSVSDLPGDSIRRSEMLLLPVVVADEQLSGEKLDGFLAAARKLLDK